MGKFDRLVPLFGISGIEKLNNASVAIIGLGGVGGACATALARSGIGKLIICDFDTVEETNINRQVVATASNIGKLKTDEIEKLVLDINPEIKVVKLSKKVDNSLFDEHIDFLIDAIDDLPSKVSLIKECLVRKVDFISSMGAAKKINPKAVEVIKLSKTTYDPVAKVLRKEFKNQDFMCVSSTEEAKCESLGSYMMVVNTFSLLLSDYCVKKILEK